MNTVNDEESKPKTIGTIKVAPMPTQVENPTIIEALNEKDVVPQESKVGKKLSDLTTRRVIILVLAMLISVPIFSDSTYKDDNTSY